MMPACHTAAEPGEITVDSIYIQPYNRTLKGRTQYGFFREGEWLSKPPSTCQLFSYDLFGSFPLVPETRFLTLAHFTGQMSGIRLPF
jgi:hypothetical protein